MLTNEFTAEKKVRFLEELSKTGNVSLGCKAAKVSRVTAYKHRDSDPEFSALWDDALECAADALETEARRRAAKGTLEPVFYQGEKVGAVRKYSDTLLIFLLKGARPEKYQDRLKADVSHEFKGLSDADLIERAKSLFGGAFAPGNETDPTSLAADGGLDQDGVVEASRTE